MDFSKDDRYYGFAKTELIRMLPGVNGRFLEIGCGEGATLEYLKSAGATYVAGVDINQDAIAVAEKRGLDLALAADVERNGLPFKEREFDTIVMADVLEHLVNPWETLRKLVAYLKDDGHVLLSIPNVRHYRVLRGLIFCGEWAYSDSGILDNTHLRFFTLKEIEKLLGHAGLRMADLGWKIHAGSAAKVLNALLLNSLRPFLIFQYHVLARKELTRNSQLVTRNCNP